MKSVALHKRLTSVLLKSFTLLLFFAFSVTSFSQEIDEVRQKAGKKNIQISMRLLSQIG
jgi:hypothetical protein